MPGGLRFSLTLLVGGRIGGQRVGYTRVSSLDQNTDRQLDGVALDRTFSDNASGRSTARPQLEAMLAFVRDTVVLPPWTPWPATSTSRALWSPWPGPTPPPARIGPAIGQVP